MKKIGIVMGSASDMPVVKKAADMLSSFDVPFEMHIFSKGWHGFSLADETVYNKAEETDYNADCAAWFDLCVKWIKRMFN